MALIGLNGGLIGKQRSAFTVIAPGLWTANEQVMLKRAGLWLPASDLDAAAYIAAVEAADGQLLEDGVKTAINSFVVGCKADGIWTAIKASCILAGARTLSGALVPLVGTAPTNNNFVSGDYNRETGLAGNGSTKYLNSNRNNNTDPQNSKHLAVFVGGAATGSATQVFIGSDTAVLDGVSLIYKDGTADGGNEKVVYHLNQNANATPSAAANSALLTGLMAASRGNSSTFIGRVNSANATYTQTSETPQSKNIVVFARTPDSPARFSNARLAFYSIGESLDLALLDTRVTALINAIAAAIP